MHEHVHTDSNSYLWTEIYTQICMYRGENVDTDKYRYAHTSTHKYGHTYTHKCNRHTYANTTTYTYDHAYKKTHM